MSQDAIEFILPTAVADAGTFDVSYPKDRSAGSYEMGFGHEIVTHTHGTMKDGNEVAFAFGATAVTITNNTGVTLPQGTRLFIGLDLVGGGVDGGVANDVRMTEAPMISLNLGAPVTSDTDGICASQAGTADTAMTIAGALASAGEVDLDVPRNVVAAWTGTAVLTVTGLDEFGAKMVEVSASGTSFTGKKAFKKVTSVVPSANITGATVGTGKVLGLPAFLSDAGRVISRLVNGATVTTGTLVVGDRNKATGTTGDVRGTYSPSGTPNGTTAYNLLVAMDNLTDTGVPQFAG